MGKLTSAIARAIKTSPESPYSIAKGSGVSRSQLSRLLSGERGLNSETIERLAQYLGLEIVIRPKRPGKGGA
jgi:transcriptional regulator with XRE-family HTH domain